MDGPLIIVGGCRAEILIFPFIFFLLNKAPVLFFFPPKQKNYKRRPPPPPVINGPSINYKGSQILTNVHLIDLRVSVLRCVCMATIKQNTTLRNIQITIAT